MTSDRAGALALMLLLSTVGSCSRARDAPPAAGESQRAASLDSLVAEGRAAYAQSEYHSAREAWLRALEYARADRDAATEARLLTDLGLAAWRMGDYSDARMRGESALQLKRQLRLDTMLARSYNALGLLAWYEGRLTEAAELFGRTAEAARAVSDPEYVAKARANLALIHVDFGEFSKARDGFLAARRAGRELGDVATEANALTNLGMLEGWSGDPRAAIGWLEEARQLYRSTDDRTGEEAALGQLARAYADLGEPSMAFAVLDTALHLAREHQLRREEAANLESLAGLYQEAGDLRRALRLYDQARAVNTEIGLVDEAGADLLSAAAVHAALGNPDLAVRYATEALEIHRSIGARFRELADLVVLAEIEHASGAPELADRSLDEARVIADALDVRSARVGVALARARIADERGHAVEVLRLLDRAAEDLDLSGPRVLWEVHALRARAHRRLGDLRQAVEAGRNAVATVEMLRGNFGSEVLRTTYVADKGSAYFDLVDMLLEAGRTEDAFEVADAARGRALAEHLAVAGGQPRALGALAEGDELLRRIDGLSTKIVEYEEYGDVDAVRQLAERLSEARREYELLLINVAERSAPNAELLGMRPADAAAVRLAMSPDEAIVAYLVGRDELLTFVVRREGVSAFTTSATARSLASRVRLVRGLVAQGGRSVEQAYAALTGLHDVLIARLARADALDDVRRLIIVPQGVLTYLPFASLRDRGTGRYLVQDYALLYLPSAGALPVLRGVRGERGGRAGRGGRGGPRVSLDARAQSAAAVFAPLPDDLPATEVEARTVQRILGRARLHVGSAATESRLRESLEGDGIVHVASHGVMNLVSPMFSRVEMVRSGAGKSANDGRLELHEVLGLSIRSPLVFLSGCETGLGAAWSTGFAAGEDYATLARAFLYAGAPNVVATLWRVADRGSGEFAERFYRHLRDVGPVEALARAQRDMLGHSRYGHPYYWAPYLVAGAGALRAAAQETARLSVPQEIPGS